MSIPPPMPTSTANWHWKNKNITPWAKSWFERELVTVSVKGEGEEEVSISKVVDVDGDVELGQRKSKLITIYDCKMELKWSGKASDGTEVEGTLSIPEVSHEVTLDGLSDYVYNWSLTTSSSPAVDALYKLAKSRLPTALEAKFAEFPVAIIEIHGKDLTVSTDTSRSGTPAPSGSTPKPATSSSAKSVTSTPAPVKKAESKSVSSTTVTVDATFQASADDLFSILTDEKRIPSWTRAPAQSSAQADTEYSLFAGNVRGKYISLTPGKEIKQTWSLQSPTWPSGHFATLTTTLDQSTDNTKVTWSLVGVPLGLEEEISRNINGYYVHGLKSIGYVQVSYYTPTKTTTTKKEKRSSHKKQSEMEKSTSILLGIAVIGLITTILLFRY